MRCFGIKTRFLRWFAVHTNKKCKDICNIRVDLRYWCFYGDTKGYTVGEDKPIYTISPMTISLLSHIPEESVRYCYALLSNSCHRMETIRNMQQEVINDNKYVTCTLHASRCFKNMAFGLQHLFHGTKYLYWETSRFGTIHFCQHHIEFLDAISAFQNCMHLTSDAASDNQEWPVSDDRQYGKETVKPSL